MTHHRHRAGTLLGITRSFERSRLEDYLVSAAYELTVPLVRRPLSSPSDADRPELAGGEWDEGPRHRSAGGFTA